MLINDLDTSAVLIDGETGSELSGLLTQQHPPAKGRLHTRSQQRVDLCAARRVRSKASDLLTRLEPPLPRHRHGGHGTEQARTEHRDDILRPHVVGSNNLW